MKQRDILACNWENIELFVQKAVTDLKGFLFHNDNHWFVIRKINENFWNLDSLMDRPMLISLLSMKMILKEQLQSSTRSVYCIPQDLPMRNTTILPHMVNEIYMMRQPFDNSVLPCGSKALWNENDLFIIHQNSTTIHTEIEPQQLVATEKNSKKVEQREKSRLRMQLARSKETPSKRIARCNANKVAAQNRRANESDEMKNARGNAMKLAARN